jgi:Secretory lipase
MLVASTLLSLLVPVAQAQVPTPDRDPFYAVPSGIDGLANGTILDSRRIKAVSVGVPMPGNAWQVKYKTLDNLGRATATVTTVMVPDAAWHGAGSRPLVSYQTAEDGADTKCSSSYALRAGVQALGTDADSESIVMRLALDRGWAVAAPDYEGPDSQFLGVKPAGIAPSAPLALWGYSGGALASAWAAQLQPSLAPELRLAGVALGGVVADLKATFLAFNGGPAGGAVPMALSGLDRSYPDMNILQYLNAAGRQTVAASAHDCIADGIVRHPFWNIASYESRPDVIDDPGLTASLTKISPAAMSLAPTGPLYMYTSQTDEFAPFGPALRLAARYCAAGVTVDQVNDPPTDHVAELAVGGPGALTYLADRFAGKAPPSTCPPG